MSNEPFSIDPNALGDLFPAEPTQPTTAPTLETQQPVVPPQATTPPTGDPYVGTYKTREAAEQGIAQKDALIEELRTRYSLATGVDPISKRPLSAIQPQADGNYQNNKRKYVEDLRNAKTDDDLVDVQTKFVMDTFAPIAPAIIAATKAQAIDKANQETPEFRAFYGSQAYKDTLEKVPDLREAIEAAEGDIKFHARLPGLYRVAYLAGQGIQLPELLRKAQPSGQNNPTPRPTAQPTTTTPTETTPTQPGLNSPSGRKAIIEAFEKRQGDTPLPWQ